MVAQPWQWKLLFPVSLSLFCLSLWNGVGVLRYEHHGCASVLGNNGSKLGDPVLLLARVDRPVPPDSGLEAKIRELESTLFYYSPSARPLVIVKDVSFGRYYAQRDLQGWTLAYQNFSFDVVELSFRTAVKLSESDVFLCLSIQAQDRHCLKPYSFRTLGQHHRYNQIHGMRNILWKKDAFCSTMKEALKSYKGRRNFTFPCWVIPKDNDILKVKMNQSEGDWIVKPSGQGEGHGIFIASNFSQLDSPMYTNYIVQPLLPDPYLVYGKKFDFRTYVLVTSVTPLRAYIYKEGLVRFASSKYDKNATKSGGNEKQFLTNTSIGKKYTHILNLTWTFQRLRTYFSKVGVDADKVFESVNEAIVRTLLASEYRFLRDFQVLLGGYDCQRCFQLLGVDVILDSRLHPIVIEVNGLPSMQLSHELGVIPNPSSPYTATKFGLMHDTLSILYNSTRIAVELASDLQALAVGVKPGPLCNEDKHKFCVDHKELSKLVDSKREFANKGGYTRIYPSANGEKYNKLILHMHGLVKDNFHKLPSRTLWHTHHLYTALEKLYTQ